MEELELEDVLGLKNNIPTKDRTLTLKGLEKQVNNKFKVMEEKIKFLERRIEIVKKCLKG